MNFKPKNNELKTQQGLSTDPEFHNKYMQLAKSVRNWQIAFLSIFILFVITLFGYIKTANSTHIVPYIIEVNKEDGIVKNIGEINKVKYVPNDRIIISALRDNIIKMREIPLDQVLYGKRINETYEFLSLPMQKKLKEIIVNENIQNKMKNKETRDVKITNIVKMNDNNYQVRWTETSYQQDGQVIDKNRKSAIFTLELKKYKDERKLLINPLGITITNFNFNTDI